MAESTPAELVLTGPREGAAYEPIHIIIHFRQR